MPKDDAREKRCVRLLIFLCWAVYTAAYVGRLNYSASINSVINELQTNKSRAGVVLSFFFFSYGMGQLINGLLCHKYNSKRIIFVSLCIAAVLNFTMGFANNVVLMCVLWGINGFVQSVFWSSIVRLQNKYVPRKMIAKTIAVMSTTTAAGTFAAYGLSALFVVLGRWRGTFFAAAALLAAVAFAWLAGVGKVERTLTSCEEEPERYVRNEEKHTRTGAYIFTGIAVVAVINGFVKDGVVSWMPVILSETYFLEDYFSMLLTLILPLISVVGTIFIQIIHKKVKSYFAILSFLSVVAFCLSAAIGVCYKKGLVPTITLSAVLMCIMYGVNNILISALPLENYSGNASGKAAGLFNMFCYLGSTAATVIVGGVAESGSWGQVFFLLAGICAAGILSGGIIYFIEKKETRKDETYSRHRGK